MIDSSALAAVDWPRLLHAYGSAADTPHHLQALGSADEQQRREALSELCGSIVHQGSRYEASPIAVAFLIDLARDPDVPDRHDIIELLFNLAVGEPSLCVPGGWPIAQQRAALAAAPPDLGQLEAVRAYLLTPREERRGRRFPLDHDELRRFERYFHIQTYDAVRAKLPVLRELVHDPDVEVATAAAVSLAYFPEEAEASVATLLSVAQNTDNPALAANAMLAASLLPGETVADSRVLWCLAEDSEVVRWAASCAAVISTAGAAPAEAVAALREVARVDSDSETPYWQILPSEKARDVLAELQPDIFEELAHELLDAYLRPEAGINELSDAIRTVWRTRPQQPVPFRQLTGSQQSVVRWIAGHPQQWVGDGFSYAGFGLELDRHGLPSGHDQLLQFISSEMAAW